MQSAECQRKRQRETDAVVERKQRTLDVKSYPLEEVHYV